LAFVVNLRDQGVQCTNLMVMREASHIAPEFLAKTSATNEQIIHCFTKQLGLTHRHRAKALQGNRK